MKFGILALLAAGVLSAAGASQGGAETLDEAIAAAVAHEPTLQKAQAETDAASARLQQARARRLPSLSLSGEAASGRTDYGPFFGFGEQNVSPRSAHLTLQQPLFAGGALSATVAEARASREAAQQQLIRARLDLEARVADAYGRVLVAQEAIRLNAGQLEATSELARQASLKFQSGESPRTDLAQAQARAAEARADVAQANADLAEARAHYHALTGHDPRDLAPFAPPPPIPGSLEKALAAAHEQSPALGAAQAQTRAAAEGELRARAGRLPEVGFVADLSSVRDQFLPGYRADGYTVGIQARWTLFSSGLQSAKVAEARAARRSAAASEAEAALAVDEGVIGAWNAITAADQMAEAAAQQVDAAEAAENSLRHEVRVSERPLLDLLNAQRETLAARTALVRARAAQVVARYQLRSLVGDGDQAGASR